MYFEKAEMPRIELYKKSQNQDLLEKFLESGLECALVKDWQHADASTACNCLNGTAKRFGLAVKVIAREGQVYLIRNI